jgi:hypothetical protein
VVVAFRSVKADTLYHYLRGTRLDRGELGWYAGLGWLFHG